MLQRLFWLGLLVGVVAVPNTQAQPTVTEGLGVKPMQSDDVDHDHPATDEISKCKIAAEKVDGFTAWVVRGPSNEVLRRFVDSNSDSKVDQWRYYKGGLEVYRDIDQDFNGKADQYRWFGTAGTRWGLDPNEDGRIDSWKTISAEEVTAEIIEAVKKADKKRFQNVLVSTTQLSALGLGSRLQKVVALRMTEASREFATTVKKQTLVDVDTEWIDFGGLRPGTIPMGTEDATKDVTVYENVVAMVESDSATFQIHIGPLVRVQSGWRAIGLPQLDGQDPPAFVFFDGGSASAIGAPEAVSDRTRTLMTKLQQIDGQMEKATSPAELRRVHELRANALEQLANDAASIKDRDMWWMQFADAVGTAAQSGSYPEGTRRLATLHKALEKTSDNKSLLAHVAFAHMSADYANQLQEENADFGKIQADWLGRLESFVERYPKTDDAPEAMLQLALAKEFAGEEQEANKWYTQILRDFADSPLAGKAAGAKRRLEIVGQSFELQGRGIDGKPFDLKRYNGNLVLVHYWATWCEPCKQDMKLIQQLQRELPRAKLKFVGVNLDSQSSEVSSYFRNDPPRWTHLYEGGGLESRLATEMGIFTLPATFLLDERGRVINRQLHGEEIREEIKKRVKK